MFTDPLTILINGLLGRGHSLPVPTHAIVVHNAYQQEKRVKTCPLLLPEQNGTLHRQELAIKKKQKHKTKDNATDSSRSRSESTALLSQIVTPRKQSSGFSKTPSSKKRDRDNDDNQEGASSGPPSSSKRLKRIHSVTEKTNMLETEIEGKFHIKPLDTALILMIKASLPDRGSSTSRPAVKPQTRAKFGALAKTPESIQYKRDKSRSDEPREFDPPIPYHLSAALSSFKEVQIPKSTAFELTANDEREPLHKKARRLQPLREVKVARSIEHEVHPHNPKHTPFPWDDPVVFDARYPHKCSKENSDRNDLSTSPVRDSERPYTPSTNTSLDSEYASPSTQRVCPRDHKTKKKAGSQRTSLSPATISSNGMTISGSSSSSTARFTKELTVALERSMQDISASDDLLPGDGGAFREAEARNPRHTMRVLAQLESLVKEQAELVAAGQRESRTCRLVLQQVLGGVLPPKTIALLVQDFVSSKDASGDRTLKTTRAATAPPSAARTAGLMSSSAGGDDQLDANRIRKRQPTEPPMLEGQLTGKAASRQIGKDQAAPETTATVDSRIRKKSDSGAKEATRPTQVVNQPQAREGKGQKRRERQKLRTGEQETPSDPRNFQKKPEIADPSANDGAAGVRDAAREESELPDLDTLLHRNRTQHNHPGDRSVNAGTQSNYTTDNPASVANPQKPQPGSATACGNEARRSVQGSTSSSRRARRQRKPRPASAVQDHATSIHASPPRGDSVLNTSSTMARYPNHRRMSQKHPASQTHRFNSYAFSREVDMPQARSCTCGELPAYFTHKSNIKPSLSTWPGGKLEFLVHCKQVMDCGGHLKITRQECRRIYSSEWPRFSKSFKKSEQRAKGRREAQARNHVSDSTDNDTEAAIAFALDFLGDNQPPQQQTTRHHSTVPPHIFYPRASTRPQFRQPPELPPLPLRVPTPDWTAQSQSAATAGGQSFQQLLSLSPSSMNQKDFSVNLLHSQETTEALSIEPRALTMRFILPTIIQSSSPDHKWEKCRDSDVQQAELSKLLCRELHDEMVTPKSEPQFSPPPPPPQRSNLPQHIGNATGHRDASSPRLGEEYVKSNESDRGDSWVATGFDHDEDDEIFPISRSSPVYDRESSSATKRFPATSSPSTLLMTGALPCPEDQGGHNHDSLCNELHTPARRKRIIRRRHDTEPIRSPRGLSPEVIFKRATAKLRESIEIMSNAARTQQTIAMSSTCGKSATSIHIKEQKKKKKTYKKPRIEQRRILKPQLSKDLPMEERADDSMLIRIGRMHWVYDRHKHAPYAFSYSDGKLYTEYRYLADMKDSDGNYLWDEKTRSVLVRRPKLVS
ncbi:MAG: hypothetical protein Q9181_003175 [Wetmoreana brouardii]